MPLRLAATPSPSWRAHHVAAALAVAAAALFAVKHFIAGPHPLEPQAKAVATAAASPAPARAPWTIVYERPAACADACNRVLDTLNAVSRDPASGIPDGAARIVVRETSGEPARDLIVLDPEGQPAGFIVHTTDPGRIVSGLATLRAAAASSASGSSLASR